MISKRVVDVKDKLLEVDLQLIAVELDTSVNDMMCLSKDMVSDSISMDAFDLMINDIEEGDGSEITFFDDNTTLNEYFDDSVVIHNALGIKYLLFDKSLLRKIENKLSSYRLFGIK
jgi:hypothetical protein